LTTLDYIRRLPKLTLDKRQPGTQPLLRDFSRVAATLTESRMAKIILYSTRYCSYSRAAKALLHDRQLSFQDHDLTEDRATKVRIIDQTGHRTFPQIFIDGEFIGGFTELQRLVDSGDLDRILGQ